MDSWNARMRAARRPDTAGLAGLSGRLGYPSAETQARERLWIHADLAHVDAHEFYPAVGCRTVQDQRVYEYPL